MTDAPKIDDRFIYTAPFRNTRLGKLVKVRILNADGHIDYAHQKGLKFVGSEIVKQWDEVVEDPRTHEKRTVRWCIAKATAVMNDGTTATAYSCVSTDDKFVNQMGREVEVSETRAKKRALADAANITEKVISPGETAPSRETVDMGLEKGDEEEPEIPAGARVPAPAYGARGDFTPATGKELLDQDDQFQV